MHVAHEVCERVCTACGWCAHMPAWVVADGVKEALVG